MKRSQHRANTRTGPRHRSRVGFSLIELVTAMLASTVIVLALGSTIALSGKMLESSPEAISISHDRELEDRMAADLRFATGIQELAGRGFVLSRPSPIDGTQQTIRYESVAAGWARQADLNSAFILDPDAPVLSFASERSPAAQVSATQPTIARIQSTSIATTDTQVTQLDIDVPDGCLTGDLIIVAVTAKTPTDLSIGDSGWHTIQSPESGTLRFYSGYKRFNATWGKKLTITASPAATIAAVAVAIQNSQSWSPVASSNGSAGFGQFALPQTFPQALPTLLLRPPQLVLQFVGADSDPWPDDTLGMAGYVDLVHATAARGQVLTSHTIAVAVRNGGSLGFASQPQASFQSSGFWLQAAIAIEAAP